MEILSIIITYGLTVLLAIPLGIHIAKVYHNEKNWMDFMAPLENLIYRFSGIDPKKEMNWKDAMKAMITLNIVWFAFAFIILMTQGFLPLNPDGNPSMTTDLAFNTAVSFIVNCNLQHYSGESGLTYLSQMIVIMFAMFVSAAIGMASLAVVFSALKERTTSLIGNFYDYFLKSITRVLLPLSIVVATILIFNGTPMNFEGKETLTTLEGIEQSVSRGPAAAMIAIKHLGTNGGGYFGVNSAHPLENPNYFTNMVEIIAQVLIPIAMIFAFGFYLRKRKLALTIFGVMTLGVLLLVIPTILSEMGGNPAIANLGVSQNGSMEGKELRFGAAASGYWSILTTVISTGSVNSMHDSSMPISGAMQLLAMMINSFYGGCGVGILNYFIYLIIAVFIAGLMVGRTPEFLGKKVEAREMKIATIIALLHPFLILSFTALASWVITDYPTADWAVQPGNWLNNPGYHGFSEMLYEFTSSSANNGSGFEGLGDNNIFWNVTCGFVLILSRYLPIIGPVAIAGLLAEKKYIPEGGGTLKTDTATFGLMTFTVIVIIAALSFFPALALGPLAEYFSLR